MSTVQTAFEMVQGYLPLHAEDLFRPASKADLLLLRRGSPEEVSVSVFDDDFHKRLEEVMLTEQHTPVEPLGSPEEVAPMEVKDGFGCAIDSIVTLAKAWATDSLISGKPVCGHTELKRQLLKAIETNDERSLNALITAGFDWGYDVQTGVASLAYRGGQPLAFTKDSIEDLDLVETPTSITAVLDTERDGLATYSASEQLRFYIQHADQLNTLRIPYRDEGRGGWLVAVVSDITGAYLHHELAFAEGYLKKLEQVVLDAETFDHLVEKGVIVAYNPQEDEEAAE